MKTAGDNHWRDVNSEPGQWAMVKLRPYHQLSVTRTPYSKLAKRFYCRSKASRLILMMPKTQVKNQDSSKFQNQRVIQSRFKQVSKNQRVIQSRIKIQVKNQEKTQDMQEPLR